MYKEITFSAFTDAFRDMDRKENFSYEGLQALYDYLEDYEESTGEKVELDVIALCVEYTEYEDLKELQANYNDIESIEDLQDHTQVIPIKNIDGTESERFIIQDF